MSCIRLDKPRTELSESALTEAGVQMPAIQRASCRRPGCCTGTAPSNRGTILPFTWTCGRGGSSQTPPEDSPWFDLT
ncbi:Hypothetical protein SMAX5B_000865 [Scophthalmus maximus]|uniref:Uncharacterized protein n=1 Tax=Scophthalmus maximus TaxID=52904 RepID=A0A2U9BAI9_SCOMX|nr:Hypothetical protein SMAX5B_000865 [Scophthalmus maximus]